MSRSFPARKGRVGAPSPTEDAKAVGDGAPTLQKRLAFRPRPHGIEESWKRIYKVAMRFAVLALVLVLWTAGCSRQKTPYTVVEETNNPPRITPALTNQPVAPATTTNQNPNR